MSKRTRVSRGKKVVAGFITCFSRHSKVPEFGRLAFEEAGAFDELSNFFDSILDYCALSVVDVPYASLQFIWAEDGHKAEHAEATHRGQRRHAAILLCPYREKNSAE